ncbi:MAG: beta-lactamase family protein [Bacteroidales bacterium]|nr:beta-lactamase family protein [Bacteroidales bacterium]
MNKKTTYKFLSLFCCFALLAASCGEGLIEPSNDCYLQSFSFNSENTGIQSVMAGHISNDFAPDRAQLRPLVLVTVPQECNLTSLIPTFSIHEKAKLYINDVEQISGRTAADFSDLVAVKVVAESGVSILYDVIVKNGEPYIDAMVYSFMKSFYIPGISISVSKDNNIIYNSGYGLADVENSVKVTPNHLFRLASISKQFTTVCLMKLYEEGRIDLDKNIFGAGGYLNDEYPGVTGAKATVTLRHFLQHNSGWRSSPLDPMFDNPVRSQPLDGMIKYMLNDCTLFSVPGSEYSYYNLGFGVAGKVIEKVTGKGFEDYLKEVLALAGVTDVHVGRDRSGKRFNECVYYSQGGYNGYGNNMSAIAAAGGIIASTEEMMKFIAKIDGKGVDNILKKETIAEMYAPSPNYDRYALGWRLGHRLFPGAPYHSGNLAGTASIWCGDTDSGVSAAILMNSRNYSVRNGSGNFDDNYFILLGHIVSYFSGNMLGLQQFSAQ